MSSSSHSQSGSHDDDHSRADGGEEIRRGITVLRKVVRARSKGKRYEVGWNRFGQPVNPNKDLFISYIGRVVRLSVPITFNNWRHVPITHKTTVWDDVSSVFIIGENRKKFVLKEAGKLLRVFRAYLSRNFLRDENRRVNEHPPTIYADIISVETWKAFVTMRLKDSFQELSEVNRKRALKPKHPFRKARTGYAGLRQKMEEKAGGPISRALLWREGHTNKSGDIVDKSVKEVVKKIESLSESASRGEIVDDGLQDVLAQALGLPEYRGRARAFGFGVSQSDAFSSSEQDVGQTELEVVSLRGLVNTLQHQMLYMSRQILELLKQSGKVHIETTPEPVVPIFHGPSGKDSFTPMSVGLSQDESETPCQFALPNPYRIVAKGKVHNKSYKLHNRSLPPNHAKAEIEIVEDKERDTPLPMPDEEHDTIFIKDALGTFVAWPIDFIKILDKNSEKRDENNTSKSVKVGNSKRSIAKNVKSMHSKGSSVKKLKSSRSKGSVTTPLKKASKPLHPPVPFSGEINLDPLLLNCQLLGRFCRMFMQEGDQILIDMEEEIFNTSYQEALGKEQIYEMFRHEKLGASHISVYIRSLYRRAKLSPASRHFSFLCPHQIGQIANMSAKRRLEQSQYITDAFTVKAEKDSLFIAPYNAGEHWVLVVIKPYAGTIFYLDPLHGNPHNRNDLQDIFNNAMVMFRATSSMKLQRNTNWISIKCPRQMNGVDCGYYILRFMKEIIEQAI